MSDFFKGIPQIKFEGADSTNDFAFKHYNPDEIVLGKRMEDHLRLTGTALPMRGAIRLAEAHSIGHGSMVDWTTPD